MPSVGLTEIAKLRLEVISFFLMVFLLSAVAVRFIWNSLAKEFTRLPRLSLFKALGLVGLWGAFFMLVLTMISGARELMTPGAWKKDGITYKLNEPEAAEPTVSEDTRRSKLRELSAGLSNYANQHDGVFPPSREKSEIAENLWETPHASRMRFLYRPGQKRGSASLIALEPAIFDGPQLGLFADGSIRPVSKDVAEKAFMEPSK